MAAGGVTILAGSWQKPSCSFSNTVFGNAYNLMAARDSAVGVRFPWVTNRLELDHTNALYGMVGASWPKSVLFSCLRVRAQLRKW